MQIDSSTYDWLKELKIVTGRTKQLQNQQIMIGDDQAKLFQNGILVGKIITQLTDNQSVINDIARLKNLLNPATRNCLKQINYKLEGEIKSLIISGDNELLVDLLKELYKTFKIKPQLHLPLINNNSTINQNNSGIRSVNNDYSVNYSVDYYENQFINKDDFNDVTKVDISLIDLNKKLADCNSLLEFIIVGLARELNLKPKQVVSLLANNNKYLAVGLIKGMKTSFQPLCDWLQNVYVNIKTVMNFIERNESDLFRFLEMVKPGLQSSSEQVAQWASRIISKIAFEVSSTDILPQTYQWFVKENGGLQSCIFCLKRHKIITQIAKYNLSDLFIVQMRKLFEDIKEYIRYVSLIFPNLIEMQNYKEELLSNRIADFWIEQAMKMADYDPMKNSSSDRQTALQFLCDCWIAYPKHLTDNLLISNQLLDLLKKASRDFSQTLKTHSLALLFVLLENFANQKNPNTALIYKKLTFSLIENSSDTNLREFILRNFQYTFKKFATMPPDILLDPFIKQIQLRSAGNIFTMNQCDIEFFTTLSMHQGLNLKIAIQMTDILCKMYLNELIWSQSLFQSIKNLIERFIENEVFQEYISKLSEVSLQIIRDSYKRLLQPPGRFQQDYTTEQEQVIIEAQRRALIVELNKFILDQQVPNLNNEIKVYTIKAQQDLLQSAIQYKGIYQLLNYFGDPEQVIEDYKNEQLVKQEDFDYNLFKMQQIQRQKESTTAPKEEKQEKQNVGRRVSDSDGKQEYSKSKVNGYSDDIDWGDAFESSTPIRAKINNYTLKKNGAGAAGGGDTPTRSIYKNTYGANRMDFQQFEETNLQLINQKQKEKERGRPVKSQVSRVEDDLKSSIQAKKVYTNSLERRREEIEQIREKRENKYLLDDMDRLQKQQREQALKRQTEQEVNKINTKLNVGKQKQTDHQAQLIFKENELKTIQNLNKYKIVNLDDLEQRDKDSLEIVMKQYANTFKFIFNRYGNIHKMFNKKNDLFQEQKNASELISFGDVWNICKDYDLQKFIVKDDVLNIMKQVNSNPQYTFLKYTDFVQFMIQLCIFMFSAPPKDLRGYPLGNQIKEMFRMMSVLSKRRGDNTTVFENPECLASNLDVNTIKMWNSKLLKDPDTPLPDNLKKVQEKSYIMKNEFDESNIIGLSQGYIQAYKVIQEIMKEKFGINLGESSMKIISINQVRPKPIPQMFSSQKQVTAPNQQSFQLSTENNENTANPINRNISQTLKITKKNNSMSVKDLRGNLSSKNGDQKNDQYQSLWVEKYSQYGLAGIQKTKKPIINQIEKERIKKEEEDFKRKQSQDKRIKERMAELQQKKNELEAFKAKKKQDEQEKDQKKQKETLQDQEKYQQLRMNQIEKKNELKKKLDEKASVKQKDLIEIEQKKLEQEQKKKDQIQENKKRLEFREEQRVMKLKEKKEKEDEKIKKDQEKSKLTQNKHKSINQKTLQSEKERKERQNQYKEAFQQLQTNPDISRIFSTNSRTLSTLFSQYRVYQDLKLKTIDQQEQLQYRGFFNLCFQFKITPHILTSEEVQQLYNSCSRSNKDGQQGIRYDQFEQVLLKVATKGRPIFDAIYAFDKNDPNNQNTTILDIVKQEKIKQDKEKLAPENQGASGNQGNAENYSSYDISSILATTPETLQGVIKYLDIPTDKNLLFQKIKQLQADSSSVSALNSNNMNSIQGVRGRESSIQDVRGRNSSIVSSKSPSKERNSSLPSQQDNYIQNLQKKYPKSNKYKNVQSRFKQPNSGDYQTKSQSITKLEPVPKYQEIQQQQAVQEQQNYQNPPSQSQLLQQAK